MNQKKLVEGIINRLVEEASDDAATEQERRDKGFKPYRKTSLTWAKKMDVPFTCDTLEGDNIKGKAGDYLCIGGVKGEQWPVDKDVFESTYEEADRYE